MKLNLPPFDHKLQKREGKIYILDIIRKKYVLLFPEEWVRQHFIHFLLNEDYPKSLIQIEKGHQYNTLKRRTDLVAYSRNGKPFLLVECKAPHIKMNDAVLKQTMAYNQSYNAPFACVTNGVDHIFLSYNTTTKNYDRINQLPVFAKAL
ncbi:MAG: type I restriction enzyme HsdR N-terminal domain-containing protein [Flammeovirgaceae bacterium]|nr:type I restriction enzyme HsdR N-terminal domain-containing protein [Flammeovirgaceae bacterium]